MSTGDRLTDPGERSPTRRVLVVAVVGAMVAVAVIAVIVRGRRSSSDAALPWPPSPAQDESFLKQVHSDAMLARAPIEYQSVPDDRLVSDGQSVCEQLGQVPNPTWGAYWDIVVKVGAGYGDLVRPSGTLPVANAHQALSGTVGLAALENFCPQYKTVIP
jgi:hypothetical protein